MFATIEQAITDIQQGKMIIVIDDENRENEGDFIMAAEKASAQDIHFMTRLGRGMVCSPITSSRAKELELPLMVPDKTSPHSPAFTVSIDLIAGSTTGISAFDRAQTVQALAASQTRPQDFYRPGHLFPLIAQEGGVLTRRGHTEAAIDLARLAGLYPAAVLCEIMNDEGAMARVEELMELAQKFKLKVITIEDLVHFLLKCKQRTKQGTEMQWMARGP